MARSSFIVHRSSLRKRTRTRTRTRLTPDTRALFLAPLFLLAAAGCSGERLGVGAGVRPLTLADRTSLVGNLVPDGVGCEVAVASDVEAEWMGGAFTYTPLRNDRTGEHVDVYTADFLMRVRFTDDPPGPFLLIGAGYSGVYMHFTEGDDFIGLGPYAQVGTGLTGERMHLDLFWEARGWVGVDRQHFGAAWSTGIGLTLAVSF